MKKILIIFVPLALMISGLAACHPVPEGPQIEISDVWGRPSPLAEGNAAVYMRIRNTGGEDDRLIGASSQAAEVLELHDMIMENDVMIMREVKGGKIPVPAGAQVKLKRGGLHIMCIGKEKPLEAGSNLDIALLFENAGTVNVTAEVVEPGEMPMDMDSEEQGEMDMDSE